MARLWYGWDHFAQGGINEAGLFFDGAVTPLQDKLEGYGGPKGNLGDEILANCATVKQALAYLEKKKIALNNAHMMFGDRSGNAVVVEWVKGARKIIYMTGNHLTMTNFLLSDTSQGNYPCYRYNAIEDQIKQLQDKNEPVSLLQVGNVLGKAVQLPRADKNNRTGGTLYSSFIDITDMKFILAFKLDNTKLTKLDLREAFRKNKKQKIRLR